LDGLVLANEVIADLPAEDGRNTGAIRLIGELPAFFVPVARPC